MKKLLVFLFFLPSISLASGYDFNNTQIDFLTMAFIEGDKVGLAETTQSVMFQECLGGTYGMTRHGILGDDRTSFGAGQMQVKTSWEVLHAYPELITYIIPEAIDWTREEQDSYITKMTKRELVPYLLKDHRFNLALVAHNLLRHCERGAKLGLRGKDLWRRAVRAHNAGWNGSKVRGYSYLAKVTEHLQEIRKFNQRSGLSSKKSPPLW